ncbi:hypothetical protein GN316_15440 [Xylophilus sp. Kf1]|nr:hypothetical protein [Xylophilus sp. Kf1]
MNSWQIALTVGGICFLVLGVVFYSLACAASSADALEEAIAEAPAFVQSPVSHVTDSAVTSILLLCFFAAIFAAAQWLDGPSAAQAEQDVGDEVAALVGESAAETAPLRPTHYTAHQATRKPHVSVLAQAR